MMWRTNPVSSHHTTHKLFMAEKRFGYFGEEGGAWDRGNLE
jgi:hypothetical protein